MIDEYAETVAPVAPDTPALELLGRFETNADLQILPVLEMDRVVGLIERSAFLMRLVVAPAAPMTAAQIMDPEPVVVDADLGVTPLCDILLKGGDAAIMRGFIVTRSGRYLGVGSAPNLLRAVNAAGGPAVSSPACTPDALPGDPDLMTLVERELRGPIDGILALADLLRRQTFNSEALEHVKSIDEQARNLSALMQDAVDLVSRDDVPGRAAPTVLRELMDAVDADWSERAGQNGVTLLVGYEGDTELIAELDAPRLRRMFDNLIGNALKFAREGMVEARLKAHLVGDEIHLAALVRDDAPRVDLADPAATLETAGVAGGGFSLAVCRRLAARLGGRMWAENNAGRGTTVNFELQARRGAPAEDAVDNIRPLADLEFEVVPHVLIVDDNATNRVVAQALCEMFGCSCETAEDGIEALEAVQARPFDLILMDIKMPRMDGLQATRAIRALSAPQCDVPIIALTANADPADAAAYIAGGMASVVEKPIKPERLRMAMNAALVEAPRAEAADAPERRIA